MIKAERGGSLWPEYFVDEELKARQLREGPTKWNLQYMVRTGLYDRRDFPLRLEDLVVFPVQRDRCPVSITWGTINAHNVSTAIPQIESLGFGHDQFYSPIQVDEQWGKYSRTVMWVDPSGRGADKTGLCVVSEGFGKLWVHCLDGLDGGYSPQVLTRIAQEAKKFNASEIWVENNFGAGMMTSLLAPHVKQLSESDDQWAKSGEWNAKLEDYRATGQKERRYVPPLEAVTTSHRLVIDRSVAENRRFQQQLTRATLERDSLAHDDEIESLGMAVALFSDEMSLDPIVAADRHRKEMLKKEMDEMRKRAGQKVAQPAWFSYHWRN